MRLQEKVSADLKMAMKNKDRVRTDTVRVLIGEFQRQPEKELNDEQVAAIIRKRIKSEKDLLSVSGSDDSGFIQVLEDFLDIKLLIRNQLHELRSRQCSPLKRASPASRTVIFFVLANSSTRRPAP